ncbi:MAG: metalloregulator ArsR/SmtB family transcription factor [Actinomycetota bacterium]
MHPLEVISEPRRRAILALLRGSEEMSVNGLAEHFDVSRPAISQHLRVLKDAGLVDERKVGRQRLYRLNAEGIADARALIEVFLVNELDDLETAARRLASRRVDQEESP